MTNTFIVHSHMTEDIALPKLPVAASLIEENNNKLFWYFLDVFGTTILEPSRKHNMERIPQK